MNKASLLALVYFLVNATSASAQQTEKKSAEGQTTIKIEDAAGKKNKVDGDIDQEITNARMRAESGSKSKLSISTSVAYTGGAVSRPFGSERPNIRGNEPGVQVKTSAGIGISGRYRWSKNDSMTLGTSMGLMTPFQGDMDPNENQLNVFDPSIGYSRVGKIGPIQTSSSIGVGLGTSNEAKSIKRMGDMGLSVSGLRSFQNGLTAGLSASVGYYLYSNDPGDKTDARTAKPGFYGGDRRTQYTLGLFPFAEYAFSDRLSARTVFGYFNWRHLYGDDKSSRLLQLYVYQSVGVGISVTRDIYLYPNVQFIPDNIRSDFTNFAMSATLNVF